MTAPIQSQQCCAIHISANTSADVSDADGDDNDDCQDYKNDVDDDDEDDHNKDVDGDTGADDEEEENLSDVASFISGAVRGSQVMMPCK